MLNEENKNENMFEMQILSRKSTTQALKINIERIILQREQVLIPPEIVFVYIKSKKIRKKDGYIYHYKLYTNTTD